MQIGARVIGGNIVAGREAPAALGNVQQARIHLGAALSGGVGKRCHHRPPQHADHVGAYA